MPWHGYLIRGVVALLAAVVISVGMVLTFARLGLAIDWDIPEANEQMLGGPSIMVDRHGRGVYRFKAEVEHRPVPIERISVHLQNAVVATEDHRFYEHQGVDPISVVRAVVRNVRTGEIREGGSTLTQQYVKNVYVGTERTYTRKISEALVALQLEKEMSKQEILEAYLNRAYFGEGAYGAEAAARTYFGKPAAELTPAEAATIASTLTAPTRFSPRNDPVGAVQRRDRVLDQMLTYGLLERIKGIAAKREPLGLIEVKPENPAAPYFVTEVREQMLDAYGPDALYRGGLMIRTTLDLERQFALEQTVRPHLPADPNYDAGVAVVEPRTGDVLATWSGRDYSRLQVDLASGRGMPASGRQSGSTFKPIVLATALEQGKTLETRYAAPGKITIADYTVGGGGCGGSCTLRQAIVRSINTVFVQLGRDVGVNNFTQMARRLGARAEFSEHNLSQALGTTEVSPLDLASVFATFANDGVSCPARYVLEVRNPDGGTLPPPDPRQPSAEEREAWNTRLRELGYKFPEESLGRCYRAISPYIARTMNQALQQAVSEGTGRRAQIDRPQAGKTGTTDDSQEIWFVGYTPDLVTAVSFYYVPGKLTLANLPGCRQVCYGGDIPALIWHDVALALLEGVPATEFPEPGTDDRGEPLFDRRRLGPAMDRPPWPSSEPEEPTFEPEPTPTTSYDPDSWRFDGDDEESEQPTAEPSDDDLLDDVLPG